MTPVQGWMVVSAVAAFYFLLVFFNAIALMEGKGGGPGVGSVGPPFTSPDIEALQMAFALVMGPAVGLAENAPKKVVEGLFGLTALLNLSLWISLALVFLL